MNVSRFVRFCPGSDFLNLFFGLLAGVAINVATTVATDSTGHGFRQWAVAALLSAAAISVGSLAVVTGRVRDDTLAEMGSTFTAAERRTEIQAALNDRRGLLATLEVGSVILVIGSIVAGLT